MSDAQATLLKRSGWLHALLCPTADADLRKALIQTKNTRKFTGGAIVHDSEGEGFATCHAHAKASMLFCTCNQAISILGDQVQQMECA